MDNTTKEAVSKLIRERAMRDPKVRAALKEMAPAAIAALVASIAAPLMISTGKKLMNKASGAVDGATSEKPTQIAGIEDAVDQALNNINGRAENRPEIEERPVSGESVNLFIKAMTEKNYAEANKYLKDAVNQTMANTIRRHVKKDK